jgi:hypothetical protein
VPEQAFTCSLDTPKKKLNLLAAAPALRPGS